MAVGFWRWWWGDFDRRQGQGLWHGSGPSSCLIPQPHHLGGRGPALGFDIKGGRVRGQAYEQCWVVPTSAQGWDVTKACLPHYGL